MKSSGNPDILKQERLRAEEKKKKEEERQRLEEVNSLFKPVVSQKVFFLRSFRLSYEFF